MSGGSPPGPSLKSTALAHPPLRWETPGPERGGPRVACCKDHHQLTASAPAQSAVLEGGQGSCTQKQGPWSHACEPRCQPAPLGPSQASLQLPALPEILRLPWLETCPSGHCPSLPVCPCPRPLFALCLCLSSAWRTRRLNSGLRGPPYILGDPSLMMFAKT